MAQIFLKFALIKKDTIKLIKMSFNLDTVIYLYLKISGLKPFYVPHLIWALQYYKYTVLLLFFIERCSTWFCICMFCNMITLKS